MKAFKTLLHDFSENRWSLAVGFLALIIVDVLQLFIPRVVKYAIDALASGGISSRQLVLYGAEVLILALGIGGFRYVWRWHLLGASRRVERSLRDRLFTHLQALPVSYFSRVKVGDLMAHATNDVDAVRMSIAMGWIFLVDTMILGVMTIFFMIYIHPLLTLYAVLPMPLVTLVTFVFSRVIHRRFELLQKAFSSITERVRESIAGIRLIKAYVREERERANLSGLSQDYVRKSIDVTKVWGMFFPLILFFSNLSVAIVLYLGGRLTILQSISPGDFVAFMSYLGVLIWPMMALGWGINMVQRGAASLDRLNRIFREVPQDFDFPGAEEAGPLKGPIEIRGLTVSAANGRDPLLREIDLTFKEGERVAMVGRTGSGKTVFCELLVRALKPPEGSIFFDEVDIHRISLRRLRRSIAYVPQDTMLFSYTIRENIAFGRLDASDAEIEEAARLAQIYDEIQRFPDGMNTVIGEKGITLSGGQRQRIAIARAILMNSPIFILDDALSSVDSQTERHIMEGMEKFLHRKTSILITHRTAPLVRADRIVVLEAGRVAETGDHATLLARGGVYAELYWKRQLEEELEQENRQ